MTTLVTSVQNKVEDVGKQVTAVSTRRHDVDWLRTIALGLLIIYHANISFQPWGSFIGFPQNDETLEVTWLFMGMLNVWRIPILFVISGMGVRFAMERRDWKQLLKDRTVRILIPFVFGILTIVPAYIYIILEFYNLPPEYKIEMGHLWFLANIFAYVLLLMPILYYLKNRPNNIVLRGLAKMLNWPLLIILVAVPLMLEAWLVNPEIYTAYGMPHAWLPIGIDLLCYWIPPHFIKGCLLESCRAHPLVQPAYWFLSLFGSIYGLSIRRNAKLDVCFRNMGMDVSNLWVWLTVPEQTVADLELSEQSCLPCLYPAYAGAVCLVVSGVAVDLVCLGKVCADYGRNPGYLPGFV